MEATVNVTDNVDGTGKAEETAFGFKNVAGDLEQAHESRFGECRKGDGIANRVNAVWVHREDRFISGKEKLDPGLLLLEEEHEMNSL
jgi:hypothetical protein